MHRTIPIATIQLDVKPAPVSERLERAEKLIVQSVQAGAKLIVLPEVFNTGYAYCDENFGLVEEIGGITPSWMKATSARLGVHLAGSILLRDEQEIYNALLLYAPDGRFWRYDKNFPWGWERAYFRGAAKPAVAETKIGNIGLMICWDMAHASLWREYAGKVDLVLACSCPPNIPDPVYHFPGSVQVTAEQIGPIYASMRHSARRVFIDTPAQQAAWMGVPFVSSTACGMFHSPIPNPVGSFIGLLVTAPWLIRYLSQVSKVEVSASMVESACILASDGCRLASLRNEDGETFVMADVEIADICPRPNGKQPRPPISHLVYFVSDKLLSTVSLGIYARGKHNLR